MRELDEKWKINHNLKDGKCLYKYRPLAGSSSSELNVYTKNLLENGDWYFSKPSDFNDPYDTKYEIEKSATEDEIRQYFINIINANEYKKNIDDFVFDEINRLISNCKDTEGKINTSYFMGNIPESKYSDNMRILCLAQDETNILMWSHYAENHTGICIGLKTYSIYNKIFIQTQMDQIRSFSGIDFLQPVSEIIYSNTKPNPYNFFTGSYKDIIKFYLTKSIDWEYEKEMRVIVPEKMILKNPVWIDESQISEIIFGLNASDILIEKVINIIRNYTNRGNWITIYKCKEIKGAYEIEKEKFG